MELNSILFPAPEPSYDRASFKSEMVWIPNPAGAPIPCLYLRCPRGSSKVLIYFHGNAEDVGLAYSLLEHLRSTLMVRCRQVHVMAVEYPGYGIYPGEASSARLLRDSEVVFRYLTTECRIAAHNLIMFGRSIGSGPATWLASEHRLGALLLMSAYTSIRAVVRHVVGTMLQHFVAERFRNIDLMPRISCPTFLVHGQKDTLVPFQHSQALHEVCGGPCCLMLPRDMDHNVFDFYEDLSVPFSRFLAQCGITVMPKRGEALFPAFAEQLYQAPDHPPDIMPKGRWTRLHKLFS